jgi:hypothetical protein
VYITIINDGLFLTLLNGGGGGGCDGRDGGDDGA